MLLICDYYTHFLSHSGMQRKRCGQRKRKAFRAELCVPSFHDQFYYILIWRSFLRVNIRLSPSIYSLSFIYLSILNVQLVFAMQHLKRCTEILDPAPWLTHLHCHTTSNRGGTLATTKNACHTDSSYRDHKTHFRDDGHVENLSQSPVHLRGRGQSHEN